MGRESCCVEGIQKTNPTEKTTTDNKKPGQESMDGNLSRRPETAAAAADRGSSVAGERKRMHRGGGVRGKEGCGL